MRTAIIIPAYNEETTINICIRNFHHALPEAQIYVVDNNSTDNTVEVALQEFQNLACNGVILKERRKGKALAVRTAFHHIDTDIYVLVDADNTYKSEDLHSLLQPILDNEADMVVGDRHLSGAYKRENTRTFHVFGNNLVKLLINFLFRCRLNDILSGYRVFSKKFVKMYPILSKGFELETEMTLHALDKRYRIKEVPITYTERPAGSFSKVNTLKDGFNIIRKILWIFKDYKPNEFFGFISIVFLLAGIIVGFPVIIEYFETNIVTRTPLAILATGLIILATLSFTIGIILHSIVKHQKYNYELLLNAIDYKQDTD